MAQITFTIPDPDLPRFVAAYGQGWSPTLPDGVTPNPQTQAQYARAAFIAAAVAFVKQFESDKAVTTALVGVTPLSIT